jgi:hypothetical protein
MLEGILTFFVGLFAFFYLPASPTQTVTRWRKKPWFSAREETIIVNRVLRDDPTKSDMHNREGLSLTDLKRSLLDFDMWPVYLVRNDGSLKVLPETMLIVRSRCSSD